MRLKRAIELVLDLERGMELGKAIDYVAHTYLIDPVVLHEYFLLHRGTK